LWGEAVAQFKAILSGFSKLQILYKSSNDYLRVQDGVDWLN